MIDIHKIITEQIDYLHRLGRDISKIVLGVDIQKEILIESPYARYYEYTEKDTIKYMYGYPLEIEYKDKYMIRVYGKDKV